MSFAGRLPQTAVVEPYAGEGATGPVFSAPRTVPCRVQGASELVRTSQGDEVVSSALVFFEVEAGVTPESRVTVDGQPRSAISVNVVWDSTRPHHLEVRLR